MTAIQKFDSDASKSACDTSEEDNDGDVFDDSTARDGYDDSYGDGDDSKDDEDEEDSSGRGHDDGDSRDGEQDDHDAKQHSEPRPDTPPQSRPEKPVPVVKSSADHGDAAATPGPTHDTVGADKDGARAPTSSGGDDAAVVTVADSPRHAPEKAHDIKALVVCDQPDNNAFKQEVAGLGRILGDECKVVRSHGLRRIVPDILLVLHICMFRAPGGAC